MNLPLQFMNSVREQIEIRGIVQGVGFRPFIWRLARRHELGGWVRNTAKGVLIEVQGPAVSVDEFSNQISDEAPPQAYIVSVSRDAVPVRQDCSTFEILSSEIPSTCNTLISPDLATCEDCLRELNDPEDRRHNYPFINCTNCGPRFSIIFDIPYDRPHTTMRDFPMCPDCQREYDDAVDRRFHAQPNACPVCGPHVWLTNNEGQVSRIAPIPETVQRLEEGEIIAIKGLGGFHLACDATNVKAVKRLRERKGRGAKPLALMVKDLNAAESLARLSEIEKKALASVQAPILLVKPRPDTELQEWISGDAPRLGIMLPYSPLHHRICHLFDKPLVMTSGNLSEEPLAFENEDAVSRLAPICDSFLLHNRPIARPCDDSVAFVWRNRVRLLRRSRGYAPRPMVVPGAESVRPFLCVGADLKNTFCLVTEDGLAFPSQHLGDLENPESQQNFMASLRDMCALLDVKPEAVVADPHPNYHSRRLAKQFSTDLPLFTVQHHEAHFAACLAENKQDGPAIGVSWDGTGYGSDKTLWGAEFFVGDASQLERWATFQSLRLPGGDKAVYEPWRVAYALMVEIWGDEAVRLLPARLREVSQGKREMLRNMIEREINCPVCTSVGRLFDAVASIAGVRQTVTFEAEAAIALEACSGEESAQAYPFTIDTSSSPWKIEIDRMIRSILEGSIDPSEVSNRFHSTLALICVETCRKIRSETDVNSVALTGGVFQNLVLLDRTAHALEDRGFQVLTHAEIPPNDGGISYGQAAAAAARWKKCVWPSP